jgi:hypothetical protein
MPTTKFSVVLDVPLTNAQIASINRDIQSVVSKHIAAIDLSASIGRKKILDKEWLGIWLKRFGTSDLLKNSQSFSPFRIR